MHIERLRSNPARKVQTNRHSALVDGDIFQPYCGEQKVKSKTPDAQNSIPTKLIDKENLIVYDAVYYYWT